MNGNEEDTRTNQARTVLCLSVITAVIVVLAISFSVLNVLHMLNIFGSNQIASADDFANTITISNLMTHLDALYGISQQYNNSRSVRLGYNASMTYVLDTLAKYAPDIKPVVQDFTVPFYTEVTPSEFYQVQPTEVTFVSGVDFLPYRFQGNGDVTGTVVWVGLGCTADDYAGLNTSHIALALASTTCDSIAKINLAQNYTGGLLVMNTGGPLVGDNLPLSGNLRTPMNIPAFYLSYARGVELNATEGVQVRMVTNVAFSYATTSNIIADFPSGNASSIVVIGSHLDSVDAGPGVNDNGSGSSTTLEIALQLYKSGLAPTNKVRFCWFGAEELGLLGSKYYVASLSAEELSQIAVMINLDMLGSPNFYRGIYDGTGAAPEIRNASTTVTNIFIDFFTKHGLAYGMSTFDGRSDYFAFINNGIPAGGLFAGAEVYKDMTGRELYGGLANTAYDSCYHLSCDNIYNINTVGFAQLARAAGYAAYKLFQTSNLPANLVAGTV